MKLYQMKIMYNNNVACTNKPTKNCPLNLNLIAFSS